MATTYDPDLPTAEDRVRSYLRDIGPTFVFTDREIELALETQANEFRAAAFLCTTMVREAGARKAESLADRSVTYRSAAEWQQMAADLWARGGGADAPYIGGLSHAEKASQRADDDANLGAFRRDLFRAPEEH